MEFINVIGGGLAGCEAAYQIAKKGIKVRLYEMKPIKFSPAHSNKDLAEIVCSNSFNRSIIHYYIIFNYFSQTKNKNLEKN